MSKSSEDVQSYNYNGYHYPIYGVSIISGNLKAGAFVCNNPDGQSHCNYLTHKEYNKIFKSISTEKTGTICEIKNDKGKQGNHGQLQGAQSSTTQRASFHIYQTKGLEF